MTPGCRVAARLREWREIAASHGLPTGPQDFLTPGLASGGHVTASQEKRWGGRYLKPAFMAKAALAHGRVGRLLITLVLCVQFETIHPFLDGNGRAGRLLITLVLCSEKVLRHPLLYLSLYFKQNRDAYYDHLQRVRTDGAFEDWLAFFLEGVVAVASSATETARRIRQLVESDRDTIHGLGRGAASALRVHELAGQRIVLGASGAAEQLGLSVPTVNAALARLEQAGILREATGRRRGRLFVYDAYLELLQAEQ